jgi:hypothetical protein
MVDPNPSPGTPLESRSFKYEIEKQIQNFVDIKWGWVGKPNRKDIYINMIDT